MIIRKAELQDINNICLIHKYSFDHDHFTSVLSEKMLQKFYSILLQYNKYNFVAFDKSDIIGFIIAGFKTKFAVNMFIRDNFFSLLLVLVRNPKFLLQKIKLILKNKSEKNFNSKANLRLLAIAVNKNQDHKGIGTELISCFEKDIRGDGNSLYGLSVKKNNHNAIKFYKKNNFEIEKELDDAIYFIKSV